MSPAFIGGVSIFCMIGLTCVAFGEAIQPSLVGEEKSYTAKVAAHLDSLLESGRDRYGSVLTPLFMAVLCADSLNAPSDPSYSPIGGRVPPDQRALGGANLWGQQDLMRLLHEMTSHNREFAKAADEHIAYYMDNLALFRQQGQEGMLWWGQHLHYNAFKDEPVTGSKLHNQINMESADPTFLWKRMWELRPEATEHQVEQIWNWFVVDKEQGKWDRHATNRITWSVGFSQAGASFIRAFGVAYEETGNPVWRERAELLRDHMWKQRNVDTNLIPNAANVCDRRGERFWRRHFSSSHEPGYWVPMLVQAHKAFGDREWIDQAEAIMRGYLTHAFDAEAGRFYRWIRLDGIYDPDYPIRRRPFDDQTADNSRETVEEGYSSFWRDTSNHRINSPIAVACLDLYEVVDDPLFLEGAKIVASELLEREPRSDTATGGREVGARAEHYGAAVNILMRLHLHTGEGKYLDRAVYIADEAVDFLWNAETRIFRGHSKHGYEIGDGTDLFCEQLVIFDRYLSGE